MPHPCIFQPTLADVCIDTNIWTWLRFICSHVQERTASFGCGKWLIRTHDQVLRPHANSCAPGLRGLNPSGIVPHGPPVDTYGDCMWSFAWKRSTLLLHCYLPFIILQNTFYCPEEFHGFKLAPSSEEEVQDIKFIDDTRHRARAASPGATMPPSSTATSTRRRHARKWCVGSRALRLIA